MTEVIPLFSDPNASRSVWFVRTGPLGWWLSLTAPPRPLDMSSLATREIMRRAECTSLSLLGFGGGLLFLLSTRLSDPSTWLTALLTVSTLCICALANRRNNVRFASVFFVCCMVLLITCSMVTARGGWHLIWLTLSDLFCIPIFLSAFLVHRNAAPLVALICLTFVLLDSSLAAHVLLNGDGAHTGGAALYGGTHPFFLWWSLITTHTVAMIVIASVLGWLTAYSFDRALQWAEQAPDVSQIAKALAIYQEATTEEFASFLNELIAALGEQTKGRGKLLAFRSAGDPLSHAVLLLNEHLRSIERLHQQQADWISESQVMDDVHTLCLLLTLIGRGMLPVTALDAYQSDISLLQEMASTITTLLSPARQDRLMDQAGDP